VSELNRLDLSFLSQALSQFKLALTEFDEEPKRRANRDSVVMHFLIVYELAIQAIKRYVELESLKPAEIPDISFQTMIRRADELEIVRSGWPAFRRYRDARNTIAHTYTEKRAMEVVGFARDFADEAAFLLNRLEGRQADGE
jgi:nucleotidyltransferase substrate binding protein (TIGR01987 family)